MQQQLYKRFRKAYEALDLTQENLAHEIKRHAQYISNCLTGRTHFTQPEMYGLMKVINAPIKDLYLYFPPDGIDIEPEVEESKPVLPQGVMITADALRFLLTQCESAG